MPITVTASLPRLPLGRQWLELCKAQSAGLKAAGCPGHGRCGGGPIRARTSASARCCTSHSSTAICSSQAHIGSMRVLINRAAPKGDIGDFTFAVTHNTAHVNSVVDFSLC
jgi:hypothetical protein